MKKQKNINLKNASMKEILAFSVLPLGMFFINTTVGSIFNIYMTDVLKLSLSLVSIVVLGSKVWDAINDPLMGLLVDRTRTRWGKCRPYLLWFAVPLAVFTTFLFYPIEFPESMNIYTKSGELLGNGGNFAFVLVMYMLYITAYTAIEISFGSLNPLVFPNKDSRVKAVSISNTIGSMGSILPSVLVFTFIGILGNGQNDTSNMGYFYSAAIFAFIGAILILIAFAGIKEKVVIPPKEMKSSKSLKIVLKDGRVQVLLIAGFATGMINVGAVFLPYFARWNCIGIIPMDTINTFLEGILGKNPNLDAVAILPTLLSVMSGISYMLSMLIIPRALKKMTKKKLWIVMSFAGAAANIVTYIIGVYIIPYTTLAGFIVFACLRFFTNFPVGMSLVLLISMLADVTDDLEMKTGERLEATVYSFKGLLYKVSIAVFNVVVLQIIDFLGYNSTTMEEITDGITIPLISSTTVASIIDGINYTTLLNGIFFMLTAFAAVGLVTQGIVMMFLKFDENDMEEKLEAYRKQKEIEAEEAIQQAAQEAGLVEETVEA
ncbi:MAG: MFS transporter [Clostridia bacterium]